MKNIKVKTNGATIGGRWYDAGIYEVPVVMKFEGVGYYWLEPLADPADDRWDDLGIDVGLCHDADELDAAVGRAVEAHGAMEDPIWLLGATTELSVLVSGHIG